MKNKKLLLVAVAAFGLVAAGTAGVSTMAWYNATGATINANHLGSTLTTATITAQNSEIDVTIGAPDSDASSLLLSTPVDVVAGTYNCALSAGDCPYYNGTIDAAHMLKFTPDSTHLAAINVSIAITAHVGAKPIADGTYYLHASLPSPARLGVSVENANKYASYVGDVNLTLYVPFTVSGGVVGSVTKYAVLSISGTTPTSAVAESTISFAKENWTFTVDSAAGSDTAAAGSKIITARA